MNSQRLVKRSSLKTYDPNQEIYLRIRSRKEVIFDGKALSVSSVNDKGPFDILPQHANFISLIKNEIVVRTKDSEKVLKLGSGVIRVNRGIVDIFIDIV